MKKNRILVGCILVLCLMGMIMVRREISAETEDQKKYQLELWPELWQNQQDGQQSQQPGQNAEKQEDVGFGLFSWSGNVIGMPEQEILVQCILKAGVSDLYQKFSGDMLVSKEAEVSAFIAGMREKNVKVYSLIGDAGWALDAEGEELTVRINKVVDYNNDQEQESRIWGIMVDVEPYLLDEWEEGGDARQELMNSYLNGLKRAYDHAVQNRLEFWVCIPNFYDRTNRDVLEELVASVCDGVAVMNYDRTDEYGQIAMEIGFAREYGKKILCIYELQEAGIHDLKEINTYANIGLEALWQSAKRLERQFGYDRLQFAYHYYEPLKGLLAE